MGFFSELTPHQQKAIVLLTQQLVHPDIEPLSYEQIAEQVGCTTKTLWEWRTQNKKFMKARDELTMRYAAEMVTEGFTALRKQIRNRNNVKAVEVLFKSQGLLQDVVRQETTLQLDVQQKDSATLTAELDALRARLGEGGTDQDEMPLD